MMAPNVFLCHRIGLKIGQKRRAALHHNVLWSFDYGNSFFGQGDLNQEDLFAIWRFLDEQDNRTKVFTGWHQDHATARQPTKYAQVRISWAAGATRPYDCHLEARLR
jgi:hypothetical protein